MNKITRVAFGLGLIIIIGLSIYGLMLTSYKKGYTQTINAERSEKDVWFGADFESPFLKTNTPFHRLHYYAPDKNYVITAKFIKSDAQDSVTLTTSTGTKQAYLIYGKAKFSLDGQACTLQALFLPEDEHLFFPFMDATTANTTYGAGRYLEAAMPVDDKVILDFNLAYNPYCAYVDEYSCPFPPKANVLQVAIEAGEKAYHE